MTELLHRISDLVTRALDELESGKSGLSSVTQKAIRIARLRNDYANLFWLEYEMLPLKDNMARGQIKFEISLHYDEDEFERLRNWVVNSYLSERKCREMDEHGDLIDGDFICGLSVSEIESQINYLDDLAEKAVPPEGLHPVDLYFVEKEKSSFRTKTKAYAQEFRVIMARITRRVHEFLSITERQIVFGQLGSDLFEINKHYVGIKLREISPEAYEQLSIAYKRLSEDDAESRSHALTSCRRLFRTIADKVYPARGKPIIGRDGKERRLGEEQYISRLWQFVSDEIGKATSSKLLLSQISDLGNRLDRVYEMSCKGIHVDVTSFEANQCMIQTYMLIGDILRLYDNRSAAKSDEIDS